MIQNVAYLHDAIVSAIELSISDSGSRKLTLEVHCHPDCGYQPWNDRHLRIEFMDPLVIHGDLFGHMANAEAINRWTDAPSPRMTASLQQLADAGIPRPGHIASITLHSGSTIEIASNDVAIAIH